MRVVGRWQPVLGRPSSGRGYPTSVSGLWAWLMLVALCVGVPAQPARALEPVEVTVEAAIEVQEGDVPSALRQRAFAQALLEAVSEVALRYVPPARLESDGERLRQVLAKEAARFVLVYRMQGPAEVRPALDNPEVQEYVMVVNATVDATKLRQALEEQGFIRGMGPRPSLALNLRLGAGAGVTRFERYDFALEPLRQALTEKLSGEGYVVVEPALYPGAGGQPRSAAELARSLGADLGVDVEVLWTPLGSSGSQSGGGPARGGVAEVRVRSVRASDALELATVRFEAPGYAPEPSEAFRRATQALEPQLASGILFQLEQNLEALNEGAPIVRVRLANVRSLRQVEGVQKTLLELLGAREASLSVLEPGAAELVVDALLAPGSLQERMTSAVYDGFGLELVQVGQDSVELRVVPAPEGVGPSETELGPEPLPSAPPSARSN